jgi:HlyD family secretion protein
MSKKISKAAIKYIIAGVVALVAAVIAVKYWVAEKNELPDGIVSGNGRIEAKLVDVAAKEPLRVKQILVEEGALVVPGQILARLDTVTLDAELLQANEQVTVAEERLAVARASIAKQKSEIGLARIEADRSRKLVGEGAGSQRELDARNTRVSTTSAGLAESEAMLKTAEKQVAVARSGAATIQTRIDDATLKSPVNARVLYRLAEAGEVVPAGGKVLTLVNLADVYMEIFLPSEQAASIKLGSEGRITVDHDPERAVAGFVSFVSPEAQFTPKQVETRDERDKLMFRVKIQIPKEQVGGYLERIKTGVRGVGYVKIQPQAVWPESLQNLVSPPPVPCPMG